MDENAWYISRLLIWLYLVWAAISGAITYVYGTPEKHYLPVFLVIFFIGVTLLLFNWFSFRKFGFFVDKPNSK
tara:strand:+ start:3841 stop:4059 length:219 start_codon:yes stop_codon:yes gene_type:complete